MKRWTLLPSDKGAVENSSIASSTAAEIEFQSTFLVFQRALRWDAGGGAVLADGGEAREGRYRVFGVELRSLDQTDVDLLQLKTLPELVDFGRKPVCIPLEDAEG